MQVHDLTFSVFACVVWAIAGLCVGSFVNCWAWRSVRGISVVKGRSCCPACGHALGALDLVPVVGWLVNRGRCRFCCAPVSVRYPVVELLCAIVFVSLYARYGMGLEAVEMCAFASILLFASLTDLDSFVIPDGCIFAALGVRIASIVCAGVLYSYDALAILLQSFLSGVIVGASLLALALVADRILGRESMGGGDIKLFFVAGVFFGWQQSLFLIIVACVLGVIFGLVVPRFDGLGSDGEGVAGGFAELEQAGGQPSLMGRPFPFGPSIAMACWITMVAGGSFVGWYGGMLA